MVLALGVLMFMPHVSSSFLYHLAHVQRKHRRVPMCQPCFHLGYCWLCPRCFAPMGQKAGFLLSECPKYYILPPCQKHHHQQHSETYFGLCSSASFKPDRLFAGTSLGLIPLNLFRYRLRTPVHVNTHSRAVGELKPYKFAKLSHFCHKPSAWLFQT